MKFIISSTTLYSHLQAISRVINSKNSLPILDCFLLEIHDKTLSATASDNETTMTTTMELVDSTEDFTFAISAKNMIDALKELPEQPLSFEVNTFTLEVKVHYNNDGIYSLMCQSADEYPKATALNEEKVEFKVSAATLYDSVSCALFATADDELRPVMNGIYFDMTPDHVVFVASDGHKLVKYKSLDVTCSERAAFILPRKPANLLKGLLSKQENEVSVTFDDRNAVFKMDDCQLTCRQIDGRFPNYNSVIPQNNPNVAIADRQLLIGALRRISVFSSAVSNLVKLHLSADQIKISAQDIDFSTSAEETITCQYDGPTFSIGFKASFLIEILNNMSSGDVMIQLADASRAGIFQPSPQEDKQEVLMLLMPMMLND
ncbi:MAG: DNA polymerase III subunit beta [Bacteroidales bacterium]|nr:DNA polymerase III subunit beta [Bacteroidales bacterium]